jgi:hypothetical protein
MITHFNSDGTVKKQWPEALTAETLGTVAHVHFSNSIQTVPLEAGEQVGESFVAAIAEHLEAAGAQPIVSVAHVETEAELLAEIAPMTIHDLVEGLGAIHTFAEHLREVEQATEHAEPIAQPTQAAVAEPAPSEPGPAAAPIATEPAAMAPVVADGV